VTTVEECVTQSYIKLPTSSPVYINSYFKMKAACSSEMLVSTYKTKCFHNLEDHNLNIAINSTSVG